MSKLQSKYYSVLTGCVLSLFVLFFLPNLFPAEQAHAQNNGIKKIRISPDSLSIEIFVTGPIPVKVVKVAPKELLVALKNVTLEKGFKIEGKQTTAFQNIAVEKLSGNVVAVILTSDQPYGEIRSKFNSSQSIFMVDLGTKEIAKAVAEAKPVSPRPGPQIKPTAPAEPQTAQIVEKKPSSKTAIAKEEQLPDPVKRSDIPEITAVDKINKGGKAPRLLKSVQIPEPVVYVPPVREASGYSGNISDIVQKIDESGCESGRLDSAVNLLRKKLYAKAFDLLDQYTMQENFTCLEQASFLKAYAFLKSVQKEDYTRLIQAERLFQDALISYPKSDYIPYGYAAIGLIQKELNNISAAEGYFNIVKQGYLQYSGMAEILYHLAWIYDLKGYPEKALTYYKQVFEDTQVNSYIADAGVGYGKALFNKRQYLDSLSVLNYVVTSSPKKVYETSDLLLYIGNANYEVGLSRPARENLNRVLNLFVDIPGRDIILSRIGDTYGMEDKVEKAVKVYELVREKFPDTEGYIASSIGIARYLKKDSEKMEIYQMIKKKFPENTYARIAMMRLAEIYQKQGEYNNCIKEIEDLLSTHPRGLRYEAVKLMQKAYEQLFKEQLKVDEFTKVLNRYELEHNRIDRMGSRQLELSVGLAYLEAKLYEEAFNHLINAYKQYKRSSRSEQLLLGLGVAMDESGRKDDALKLFNGFTKRFAKSRHRVHALMRAGEIYLDKKEYEASSDKFKAAYRTAKAHREKGRILMSHANVFEKKGDWKAAADYRERAVKDIALASGENYEALTLAYKELGRTYIQLKKYVKSANAYDKALNFSKDEREKANLGFLLGDAYQKGNILSKAKDAFKQVVASYDSVWARLAQQRLNTLELAQMVQNS